MKVSRRIGLIAGSGKFPLIFARAAQDSGFEIFVAAHLKETLPELAEVATAIEWVHLGQVNRILKFFRRHGVRETVLLGAIKKRRMFADVRLDMKAISLVSAMHHTHDDGVLVGFARFLEKEGVVVRPSTFLLPELLAPEGCWTRRKPSRDERADIEMGWRLAKEIGRHDIGQCIVIAGGTVLAVEAIDGTDATLLRGGRLGDGRAVAVKVSKPNQDLRFDVPAVGLQTVETMNAGGVRVLAVEAGKTVAFDQKAMCRLADAQAITILGIKSEP
jgi:DUF1009 family protein